MFCHFVHSDCLQENFLPLYDLHYSFLWVTFSGRTENELLAHLEAIRENAKRLGMRWAHRRACFLLGRLCAKKLKLSQVGRVKPPSQVCHAILASLIILWRSKEKLKGLFFPLC